MLSRLSVDYPQLCGVHPEHGKFKDPQHLKELLPTLQNQLSKLRDNLDKSGRNEGGEILDDTAKEFCATGRTLNQGFALSVHSASVFGNLTTTCPNTLISAAQTSYTRSMI
jgi:hypothetical protein